MIAERTGIEEYEHLTARAVLTERQYVVWRLRRQGMSWGEMRWYLRCSRQACQQTYSRAEQRIEEAMGG